VTRLRYYDAIKKLAAAKRKEFGVTTADLGLREVRRIYSAEGITIDLRKLPAKIRAAYMCDDGDPSVLVNKSLPKAPRLFAMVHELKHHFCDREVLSTGGIHCGDYNVNKVIEIAAEIFAAEFIYPECEFLACVKKLEIDAGAVEPNQIVELKRACGATVSYKFLRKRLERFGYIGPGQFAKVQFQKLEESIYGVPFYKQPWFRAHRKKKGISLIST
jgi:Zn-dependent peptidase ImmA (M78 family)